MQAEEHEQPGKGDDKICTREFGGEEGKQVCIMITCIVYRIIRKVLLLIANYSLIMRTNLILSGRKRRS